MSAISDTLDWPADYGRTIPANRKPYPYNFRVGMQEAFENVLEQLEKMDARNVRIETDVPHRTEESNLPKPSVNPADPADPGVVVYFWYEGRNRVAPCDRWDTLRDNAQAIAKYLDAKRALDRYGIETTGSEMDTQVY